MPKFDIILFDFDGTVADTSAGIKEGLCNTFRLNSMPEMTNEDMNRFIGPPLDDSFVKYCNVSRQKAKDMVLQFRSHYHVKGIDKYNIYEGLKEAFDILKEKGIAIALATSKPEPVALHILEKAGLTYYFEVIQGADLEGKLIKKQDIIKRVIEKTKDIYHNPLMVGDTEFDIKGAHLNNISCLWVEYGFGEYDDAMRENPEYIAKNMEEMTDFFKSL